MQFLASHKKNTMSLSIRLELRVVEARGLPLEKKKRQRVIEALTATEHAGFSSKSALHEAERSLELHGSTSAQALSNSQSGQHRDGLGTSSTGAVFSAEEEDHKKASLRRSVRSEVDTFGRIVQAVSLQASEQYFCTVSVDGESYRSGRSAATMTDNYSTRDLCHVSTVGDRAVQALPQFFPRIARVQDKVWKKFNPKPQSRNSSPKNTSEQRDGTKSSGTQSGSPQNGGNEQRSSAFGKGTSDGTGTDQGMSLEATESSFPPQGESTSSIGPLPCVRWREIFFFLGYQGRKMDMFFQMFKFRRFKSPRLIGVGSIRDVMSTYVERDRVYDQWIPLFMRRDATNKSGEEQKTDDDNHARQRRTYGNAAGRGSFATEPSGCTALTGIPSSTNSDFQDAPIMLRVRFAFADARPGEAPVDGFVSKPALLEAGESYFDRVHQVRSTQIEVRDYEKEFREKMKREVSKDGALSNESGEHDPQVPKEQFGSVGIRHRRQQQSSVSYDIPATNQSIPGQQASMHFATPTGKSVGFGTSPLLSPAPHSGREHRSFSRDTMPSFSIDQNGKKHPAVSPRSSRRCSFAGISGPSDEMETLQPGTNAYNGENGAFGFRDDDRKKKKNTLDCSLNSSNSGSIPIIHPGDVYI